MTQNTFNRPDIKPWSLSHFPNYDEAAVIDIVDAYEISETEFRKRYVHQNRPCLIKKAVVHWPAYERWKATDYIKQNSYNRDITTRSDVVSEMVLWSSSSIRDELKQKENSVSRRIPFYDYLSDLEDGGRGPLTVASCIFSAGSPIEKLAGDVGGLPFMPVLPKSRYYPPHRAFLYRNSYTDWHLHPADETFMTQVVGAKEVLLLPPDQKTWNELRPIVENIGYLFNIDKSRFPGTRNLRPLRAIVEPGDALFIPVFWWHAVESIGDAFGVTVAATFPTPLHINGDMRLPVARKIARSFIFSRYAPLVIGAVTYSAGYKLLQRLVHLGR